MSLTYNGTEIEKVIFNGTELEKVVCNGATVFESVKTITETLALSSETFKSLTYSATFNNPSHKIKNVISWYVTDEYGYSEIMRSVYNRTNPYYTIYVADATKGNINVSSNNEISYSVAMSIITTASEYETKKSLKSITITYEY